MAGMPEFASAVFACKSALIIVNQHVVVQAVLAGEGCVTNEANERFDT